MKFHFNEYDSLLLLMIILVLVMLLASVSGCADIAQTEDKSTSEHTRTEYKQDYYPHYWGAEDVYASGVDADSITDCYRWAFGEQFMGESISDASWLFNQRHSDTYGHITYGDRDIYKKIGKAYLKYSESTHSESIEEQVGSIDDMR